MIRIPNRAGWASAALFALTACSGPQTTPAKPTTEAKPAAAACAADPAWIQNPSQPDFQKDPNSVCAFHQYAWQSFLHLTSPALDGDLVFENFAAVKDVFASKMPAAMRSFVSSKTKRKRIFEPRAVKPVEPFNEDTQAGSGGILVSQSKDITYYEQLLDSTAVGFVKSCDLTAFDCQRQPAAQTLRFPAGAIEVKASWVPMSKAHPNADLFYKIPGFPVQKPDGSNYTPDFMALTGFHLVFATKGHPELIWATFEHIANAPDGPCVPGATVPPPVPFQKWTFNDVKDTSCKNINTFDPATKPPAVNQVVRITPFGGGTPENVSDIKSLNASVLTLLPSGSVWRNYFLVGSLWTKNGVLPPAPSNEAGSTQLANATMETFKQNRDCFSCHNNKGPASGPNQPPFLVSHAFPFKGSAKPACSYTTALPSACKATQPTQ